MRTGSHNAVNTSVRAVIVLASTAVVTNCAAQQTYPGAPPSQGQASPVPQASYPVPQQNYPAYPGTLPSPTPPIAAYPAYPGTQPGGQQPSMQSYPGALPGTLPAAPFGTPAQIPYASGAPAPSGVGSIFRNLFAVTVAGVLTATGTGVALDLGRAVTGGILGWFTRKSQRFTDPNTAAVAANAYSGGYGQNPLAASGWPSTSSVTVGTTPYPASLPGASYSSSASPGTTSPTAIYPGTSGTAAPTAPYPATGVSAGPTGADPAAGAGALQTGTNAGMLASMTATPNGTSASGAATTVASTPSLYAGLAYEVHLVDSGGTSIIVDPSTYVFHSGDKFVVYFRPSLPGQMEVDNVNASGKRTQIDAAQMAAGQLTTLGPYRFTGEVGDESLHFVLSACSTPDLLTRTRDIVNASPAGSGAGSAASPPLVQLASCGTTTRGVVQTRDIERVATEGSTTFALDPVAPSEVASGVLAPREVKLVFHHR